MLVLSRKAGEKIVLGDSITVEVVRISGNRVAIGITAPDSVKILRAELESFGPDENAFSDEPAAESPREFSGSAEELLLCEAC